ncbi:MAG: phosphatidate cytidylyltransferase [Angustibacter sp.]
MTAGEPTRATRREHGPHGRAGRNLPMAIAVGLGLGVMVIAGLFIRKELFLVITAVGVCLALWELSGALRQRGLAMPLIPVLIGSVAMLVAAYSAGAQALVVCFTLTNIGVLIWRISEGGEGALQDISAGVFATAYLPLLAGFVPLMLAESDGARRVLIFVLLTVCSDVGGYAVGVLFGRHPMAPSISPKKSWEGFAGSMVVGILGGCVALPLLFAVPWWGGLILGPLVVAAATLGDLAESLVKRDVGIKDMGAALPGHGGVLDRLDSLVMAAPVAWLGLFLLV